MRSMADMRREQDDAKGKGKGKKGTESYSGGERSGMAVFNPNEAQPDGAPADPFAAARAAGAVLGSDTPANPNSRTITIYADGFTINDGPLRQIADPANKKFLDDLHQGRAPEELKSTTDEPVDVNVVDKRTEKWQEKGPGLSGGQSSTTSQIKPGQGGDLSAGSTAGPTATGEATVNVDQSRPVTSIMIRFGDGRRVQQEFNEDALVQELYDYVQQSTGTSEFKLCEGFPPKPVIDRTKTIKDSGLLKASLVVKS